MKERNYEEKIKREMTLLEKILSYIPGYRGYKEKEIRRESDRLVRMEAANRLKEAKEIIRMKLTDLVNSKKIEDKDISKLDIFLSRLDRVLYRIERAPAGYAGLFDVVKVKEDKLDKVLENDLKLIEKTVKIKELAREFEEIEVREELLRSLDEILEYIQDVEEIVDKRSEVFRGLSE
ncbi:MAG: hypothetical protein NZ929_05395 [Aigarchaeota archaeon]|nr:hypothetical protein [Aigarchaeota archaeon]MCX8193331.1 hypothetical protein [Nitrososphaeria archaeon]MDW7985861.1 hypothetical protein [Nitrososphaerota archaeon]